MYSPQRSHAPNYRNNSNQLPPLQFRKQNQNKTRKHTTSSGLYRQKINLDQKEKINYKVEAN